MWNEKPKYRIDTYPLEMFDLSSESQPTPAAPIIVRNFTRKQLLFEDRLDELGEQGWRVVSVFAATDCVWVVSERSESRREYRPPLRTLTIYTPHPLALQFTHDIHPRQTLWRQH